MKVSIIFHAALCVTAAMASYDAKVNLDAGLTGTCTCSCVTNRPKDCVEAKQYINESGVVLIYPLGDNTPLRVYCDQDTDGGGWLVFQRRINGSADFYQKWTDYQSGFGNLEGEFWLGLDTLHAITARYKTEMRVEFSAWNDTSLFVTYSDVTVSDACNFYQLKYENMTDGNVANSLSTSNGARFSTQDGGNKQNCAKDYKGGWWYGSLCGDTNLNGLYKNSRKWGWEGIFWYGYDRFFSLKRAEMKIRPM